jgi:hypothetical protein
LVSDTKLARRLQPQTLFYVPQTPLSSTPSNPVPQKMNINLVNALFDNGTFMEMYKAGFITDKVFLYREIYLWIQAQMQTRGINKNTAVLEAEVKFGKDERTIWRALNSFSVTDKTVSPIY